MLPRPFPPLHVVTDDAVLSQPDFAQRARQVLEAGAGQVALHLRGPNLSGRMMYELAEAVAPLAQRAGALLLINDRLDVALASGAHGAQMGRRGIPVVDARRLLGVERVLGASVHSLTEAEEAVSGGADFLLVGPLYETASHPGRRGAGVELLRELSHLGVPLVGIGGITEERVAEVREARAVGVAVLRGIWSAREPGEAARGYLRTWKEEA